MSLFAKPYTAMRFNPSARSSTVSNALGSSSPFSPVHTPTAFAASTRDDESAISASMSAKVFLTARAHPGEDRSAALVTIS